MRLLLTSILAIMSLTIQAQEHVRTHSVVAGGGWGSVLDTYLSPYSYKGPAAHIQRQTERMARQLGMDSVLFQTVLDIDCSFTKNPGRNVKEYAGGVRYAMNWLKVFRPVRLKSNTSELTFAAGPGLSGYLGCVYNDRNGNNPAQAKADLMVDLSARGQWAFNLLKRRMSLTGQISFPVAGMAFSPNYGQSYYETFRLRHYDHNVVFANFVNMPSMRTNLSLDIPVRKVSATTLRLTYAGYFMQSKFNGLRYHSYTHSFMIGVASRLRRL